MGDKYYKNGFINFIKYICSVIIIFSHYQLTTGAKFNIVNFSNDKIFNGGYVVELFFLISGFLSFSYIQKIKDGCELKDFYFKKIKRLLPLVVLSSVFTFILKIIYRFLFKVFPFGEVSIWSLFISCLGIQCGWINKNPSYGVNETLWYISVLLLCYIIFYIITNLSYKYGISEYYVYIFMIFIGVGIQLFKISLPFFNRYTAIGYYAFFTGIILAFLINKYKLRENKKIRTISTITFITLSAFYIFVHFLYRNKYLIDIKFATNNIRYILTFVCYPSLVIMSYIKPIAKIASNGIINKLGELSFDAYVWHLPLLYVMNISNVFFHLNINYNSLITMILFCAGVYIWSFVVHKIIKLK